MPQSWENQVQAIAKKYRQSGSSPNESKNIAYAIATKNFEKKHGTTPLGNPIPTTKRQKQNYG